LKEPVFGRGGWVSDVGEIAAVRADIDIFGGRGLEVGQVDIAKQTFRDRIHELNEKNQIFNA